MAWLRLSLAEAETENPHAFRLVAPYFSPIQFLAFFKVILHLREIESLMTQLSISLCGNTEYCRATTLQTKCIPRCWHSTKT